MDLRQAVETVKRILTKEKIDRKLAGHTSLTPFMSIKEGFGKKVTFDMTDGIEQKIDKLTAMMGRLVMKDKEQNRQFKPGVYQSNRGRGKTRCNYDQRIFQGRFRPNNAYRGRPRYRQDYRCRTRYDSYNRGSYRYSSRGNQSYGRSNNSNNRRGNFRSQNYDRNRSRSYERQTEIEGTVEVLVIVDQGQVQRLLQIEIGLDALSVGNTMIL